MRYPCGWVACWLETWLVRAPFVWLCLSDAGGFIHKARSEYVSSPECKGLKDRESKSDDLIYFYYSTVDK